MMSLLSKINRFQLLKNSPNVNFCAYYSRRSNSKNADNIFKVVKGKVQLGEDNGYIAGEGSPNWELFAQKGNRFYLPGSLGPAWQSATTTATLEVPLEKLVDFNSEDIEKLHVSSKQCPVLLRKNLHELFPAPEVISPNNLTMITLSSYTNYETDNNVKNFVIAAREICSRLRLNGYWSDFMNPFSGRPFYSYASGRKLYKIDQRFRGIGIKTEDQNHCMIISSDEKVSFSGCIFTNAPYNLPLLQSLIMEEEIL